MACVPVMFPAGDERRVDSAAIWKSRLGLPAGPLVSLRRARCRTAPSYACGSNVDVRRTVGLRELAKALLVDSRTFQEYGARVASTAVGGVLVMIRDQGTESSDFSGGAPENRGLTRACGDGVVRF